MKDFDQERATVPFDEEARTFRLRGETFTIKQAVRPEVLVPASRVNRESVLADDVTNVDATILAVLDGDGPDRYRQIRESDDDPITFIDMMAIVNFAIEVATGRPTRQPGSSGAGPSKTGTGSTGEPPLRAVEA